MIPEDKTMRPGLFKLSEVVLCRDPEHAFPSMLWIPPGHGYVHRCPNCGRVEIVTKPDMVCDEARRAERQKFIDEYVNDLTPVQRADFAAKIAAGESRPPWEN